MRAYEFINESRIDEINWRNIAAAGTLAAATALSPTAAHADSQWGQQSQTLQQQEQQLQQRQKQVDQYKLSNQKSRQEFEQQGVLKYELPNLEQQSQKIQRMQDQIDRENRVVQKELSRMAQVELDQSKRAAETQKGIDAHNTKLSNLSSEIGKLTPKDGQELTQQQKQALDQLQGQFRMSSRTRNVSPGPNGGTITVDREGDGTLISVTYKDAKGIEQNISSDVKKSIPAAKDKDPEEIKQAAQSMGVTDLIDIAEKFIELRGIYNDLKNNKDNNSGTKINNVLKGINILGEFYSLLKK